MKFAKLLFLFVLPFQLAAQDCFQLDPHNIPPTPYVNSYLSFDGYNDVIRSKYFRELTFKTNALNQPAPCIDMNFQMAIKDNYGPNGLQDQSVISQYFQSGWTLHFDAASRKLQFWITNPDFYHSDILDLCVIPDSNWHTYRLVYKDYTLVSYFDGSMQHTYPGKSWTYDWDSSKALAIGAKQVSVTLSELDLEAQEYFCGYFHNLKILGANDSVIMNVKFDWGGGLFALDSASFFIADREDPTEGTGIPGMVAFLFGTMPGVNKHNPTWVNHDRTNHTEFSTLGSGFAHWREATEGYVESLESWQANGVVYNGSLYVTGDHNRVNGDTTNEGDVSYGISMWDPAQNKWKSLNGGIDGYGLYAGEWNGKLVDCGHFTTLHDGIGVFARSVALWDGSNWSVLTDPKGGNYNTGLGMWNDTVTVDAMMCTTFEGDLIVGGNFTKAGSIQANRIARWNRTNWSPMGAAFYNGNSSTYVMALAVYNNVLYTGGNFTTTEGRQVNGLAKWNEDSLKWVNAEPNFPPNSSSPGRTIQVLYVYNGKLWAGGSFISIDGVTCNGVAYYDGTNWHPIGNSGEAGVSGLSSFSTGGEVTDMTSDGTNLYICGSFTKVNGQICNKVAKFNGSNWCSIGFGADLRPEGLCMYQGSLVITGDLYSADGNNFNNIALYNPNGVIGIKSPNSANNIPVKYGLSQNYPNPFNPSTTIKYQIEMDGVVTLNIYDITGRRVKTLVDQYRKAGEYETSFNASDIASGVYIYRIQSGAFSSSKKMVLLK